MNDLLRQFYVMGYFRGRADALDGRPYDARLPNERGADDSVSTPQEHPSSSAVSSSVQASHPDAS